MGTQENHLFAAICAFIKLERLKNQSLCPQSQALYQGHSGGF
jgi:hypothetical protein